MATATADDLKRVPLFADLDSRQLKKLASHFRERTVAPGTSVVQEGEMSGVGFFVVAEGEASVSVNGNEVKTIGPGDHFGEVALVSEGKRSATVTATTELRRQVDVVDRDLERLLRGGEELGERVGGLLGRLAAVRQGADFDACHSALCALFAAW